MDSQLPQTPTPLPELPAGHNHLPKFHGLLATVILVGITAVIGAWFWHNANNVEEYLPAHTPRLQDTSTWKTYRNEDLGFEFKYPPQVEVMGDLELSRAEENGLIVWPDSVRSGGTGLVLHVSLSSKSSREGKIGTFAGRTVYVSEYKSSYGADLEYIIIPDFNDNIDYDLRISSSRNPVFDQILSTFKFIEPGQSRYPATSSQNKFFFMGFQDSGIFSVNYDSSGLSKILNESVYASKVSPDFKRVAYIKEDQSEKEIKVKLFDVATNKSSTIVRHPKDEIGPLINQLKWSRDSKMLTWHSVNYKSSGTGEVHHIAYLKNGEDVRYVRNPYTGYIEFQRIDGYGLSPDGNYVYMMGDIENSKRERKRALILYNIAKEDIAMYFDRDDLILHEIFFDINSDLYFAIPGQWMKYGLTTGKAETFKNKPGYWDKLKYAVYAPEGVEALYYCTTAMKSLCTGDAPTMTSEKKITPLGEVRGLQDYIWSPDSKNAFYLLALDKDPFWWYIYSTEQTSKKLVESK